MVSTQLILKCILIFFEESDYKEENGGYDDDGSAWEADDNNLDQEDSFRIKIKKRKGSNFIIAISENNS